LARFSPVMTGGSATVHVFGESVWKHMQQHPEQGNLQPCPRRTAR
jgi:hypothetical protein